MDASRVSVTEVLRDSTSTSPDCSAVKRCCETSGTHFTLLASPSSAAAIALPTSTSRPLHWPLLSAAEKPGTPLLMPVGWLQAAAPDWGLASVITATATGIVWAYLVRFCAVALQSMQSGYARIPVSFDDSARMLGTGSWGLMARVHWPLLKRSTAAAALLVFVDVMKELPATMVLRPFNSDTLAVVAYQLARDERLGEAALPSLALVAVGLVPVIRLSRTLRSK